MRMPNGQGLLSLCGAAAVMMVLVGAVGALTKPEQMPQTESAQPEAAAAGTLPVAETTTPAQTAPAPEYVLRVWGDGLGLFLGDAPEPYRVVEAELSVLPDCDRAALTAGIHAPSEATLRVLLEDYAS